MHRPQPEAKQSTPPSPLLDRSSRSPGVSKQPWWSQEEMPAPHTPLNERHPRLPADGDRKRSDCPPSKSAEPPAEASRALVVLNNFEVAAFVYHLDTRGIKDSASCFSLVLSVMQEAVARHDCASWAPLARALALKLGGLKMPGALQSGFWLALMFMGQQRHDATAARFTAGLIAACHPDRPRTGSTRPGTVLDCVVAAWHARQTVLPGTPVAHPWDDEDLVSESVRMVAFAMLRPELSSGLGLASQGVSRKLRDLIEGLNRIWCDATRRSGISDLEFVLSLSSLCEAAGGVRMAAGDFDLLLSYALHPRRMGDANTRGLLILYLAMARGVHEDPKNLGAPILRRIARAPLEANAIGAATWGLGLNLCERHPLLAPWRVGSENMVLDTPAPWTEVIRGLDALTSELTPAEIARVIEGLQKVTERGDAQAPAPDPHTPPKRAHRLHDVTLSPTLPPSPSRSPSPSPLATPSSAPLSSVRPSTRSLRSTPSLPCIDEEGEPTS